MLNVIMELQQSLFVDFVITYGMMHVRLPYEGLALFLRIGGTFQ